MNFHDTAIKYAQLAAAAVDSRGHLLHQVGSYPAGTVRDAELAELEQGANRENGKNRTLRFSGQP